MIPTKKKIGIFGGTFDPPHNAHLLLADAAMREFSLDGIIFMPAKLPPHKNSLNVSSVEDRFNMVRLAIEGCDGFIFSDFEEKRDGKSYTADTLTALKELNPNWEMYFIIGGDSFYDFHKWHEPSIILKNASLLVAERDIDSLNKDKDKQLEILRGIYPESKIYFLKMPKYNLSSTDIRKKISLGEDIGACVPKLVYNYIKEHGLYRRAN